MSDILDIDSEIGEIAKKEFWQRLKTQHLEN